jgi:hypothetical protein
MAAPTRWEKIAKDTMGTIENASNVVYNMEKAEKENAYA